MNIAAMQAEEQRIARIVNEMEQGRESIEPVVKNYDSVSNKVIIFIEDSKSGYDFIKLFIKTCYPLAKIDILSLKGHGNIKYIPDYFKNTGYKYDNVIIMYDRGRSSGNQINTNNRKAIPRVIRRLKKEYFDMKIYIFSPLCFESIYLSFSLLIDVFLAKYNIPTSQYTKLHYELVDLLNNKIESIDWFAYVTSGLSVENIIEQAVEEITKNTKYQISHKPSNVSECWIKNCDNQCEELDDNCNIFILSGCNLANKHKLELVAANSALGGFTYIMDKIYDGIQYRTYPLAIANNSQYKSVLIQEA